MGEIQGLGIRDRCVVLIYVYSSYFGFVYV